jgi:nicotinamidase-related amidase
MLDRSAMIDHLKEALALDPSACAVITIDCQRGNLDPSIASLPVPQADCERVVASTNRLMRCARDRAILDARLSFTPHARSDFARHKRPDSIEAEIVAGLDVQPADMSVPSKRTFDMFHGTPLELLLRSMGKDTLLIAGCTTNTCVLASTFGAYNRGLRAVVIADCVASAYGQDLHDFALANIERRLGWVLSLDELERKLAAAGSDRTARS